MLRRHFFLFAALAAVALMVLAGGWRLAAARGEQAGGPGGGPGGPGGGPGGRAPVVAVAQVQSRPFTDRIEALGAAKARQSVTITSNTTEQITRLLFTSGQSVSRGQTLVQLEAGEQAADALQSQAALRQAERDLARQRTLFQKGFVAQARLDDAQAAVDTARAALSAQRARQGDRVIRAPFSGVIGLSDAAPGQLITPGTEIATLDDLSVIHVDFEVPERFLNVLRPGLPIQAQSDAYPDQAFQGRIGKIDTRIDPASRAVSVRAEFANPGQRIKPGMLMRISVEQGVRQSAAVPEAAVQFEADTAFVYKLIGQGERTIAQRATVETGAREAGFVELTQGVNPGERIVADGLNRIQPNQPVRIAGAAGGPGGAGGRPPGAPRAEATAGRPS